MVQYRHDALSDVFGALADPTRRAVVARLATGNASAGELAQPFGMSLTGFMKHLSVLEGAGIIVRHKHGRVVRCELAPQAIRQASDWLEYYRQFWESRLDALEQYLEQQEAPACPQPPQEPVRHSRSPARSGKVPRRSTARGRTRRR